MVGFFPWRAILHCSPLAHVGVGVERAANVVERVVNERLVLEERCPMSQIACRCAMFMPPPL